MKNRFLLGDSYNPWHNLAVEELLFDPQTSGGLLIALSPDEAPALLEDLKAIGAPAAIVGELTEPADIEILVTAD